MSITCSIKRDGTKLAATIDGSTEDGGRPRRRARANHAQADEVTGYHCETCGAFRSSNAEVMSRTRRDFLVGCSVLPRVAGAAARWLREKPSNWIPDDIQTILNHSAWVHEAPLEMDPVAAGSTKKVKQDQGLPTDFTVVVRWESGLPVRLARRKTSLPGEELDHYEVSVSRLPLPFLAVISGQKPGEDLGNAEVAALLAKSTVIERAGKDPLRAERAEWINADFSPRVSISFPRTQKDPIQLTDWAVSVVGRIGGAMFRTRFPLRPMVYRGKLEL